ncbi:MAG: hypothetical protein ACRDKB_01125 [Actinomycetota bacterium]
MATTPEDTGRSGLTGAQLALVVVGLLALLAVLWFAFLRGDDEEPAVAPPVAVTTPEPEPTEDVAQSNRRRGRVETFEVFASKDPFDPLVEPGGGGGGETLGSAEGGKTTGTTTTGGNGTETVGGHRVRVVDVFTANNGEQRAQVQVDGTVFTVEEGETFADSFQLLSLSGDCATMLFGDDQFTICEGEEIIK